MLLPLFWLAVGTVFANVKAGYTQIQESTHDTITRVYDCVRLILEWQASPMVEIVTKGKSSHVYLAGDKATTIQYVRAGRWLMDGNVFKTRDDAIEAFLSEAWGI